MPTEEEKDKPIRIPVTIERKDHEKLLSLRHVYERRLNKHISIAGTIRLIIRAQADIEKV